MRAKQSSRLLPMWRLVTFAPATRFDMDFRAGHNLRFPGGVPEWLKGADCKSVGLRLRWFESNLLHHDAGRIDRAAGEGWDAVEAVR